MRQGKLRYRHQFNSLSLGDCEHNKNQFLRAGKSPIKNSIANEKQRFLFCAFCSLSHHFKSIRKIFFSACFFQAFFSFTVDGDENENENVKKYLLCIKIQMWEIFSNAKKISLHKKARDLWLSFVGPTFYNLPVFCVCGERYLMMVPSEDEEKEKGTRQDR